MLLVEIPCKWINGTITDFYCCYSIFLYRRVCLTWNSSWIPSPLPPMRDREMSRSTLNRCFSRGPLIFWDEIPLTWRFIFGSTDFLLPTTWIVSAFQVDHLQHTQITFWQEKHVLKEDISLNSCSCWCSRSCFWNFCRLRVWTNFAKPATNQSCSRA